MGMLSPTPRGAGRNPVNQPQVKYRVWRRELHQKSYAQRKIIVTNPGFPPAVSRGCANGLSGGLPSPTLASPFQLGARLGNRAPPYVALLCYATQERPYAMQSNPALYATLSPYHPLLHPGRFGVLSRRSPVPARILVLSLSARLIR